MATKKPRLIVTLEPDLYKAVKYHSKINGTTLSVAARDLIREATEFIEDLGMVRMAEERMKVKGPRISHKDAWK